MAKGQAEREKVPGSVVSERRETALRVWYFGQHVRSCKTGDVSPEQILMYYFKDIQSAHYVVYELSHLCIYSN